MIRSPASRLSLVSFVAAFLSAGGMAQTLPRNVHPGIAPPASGALTGATAVPMFQFPDGVWNNFEGFAPAGQSSVDWGGWFNLDDGTHLTNSDVHSYFIPYPENSYWDDQHVFDSPVRPPAVRMRRFVGYMRPANVPLGPHPVFGGTWVDQGAFELFAPLAPWNGQTIVIVIGHFPTLGFPPNANHQSLWWPNTSLGWFSPDGLIREEFTGPGGFSQNIHDQDAGFPGPARAVSDLYVATWPGNSGSSSYYPICGYTFTVMQRPAELNMQSSLQLVQATKMLLMDAARTPLTRALTQSEIDTNVVVVFAGASNGGLQASWAAQLYPNIVHGAFAEVINPSMERLLGEQEFGYAVGCQSGFTPLSATFAPVDMRNWGQFTWNRGLELYDLSLPRQLLRGQIYRPFCQYIGDEDLTSTGTDWIRLSNPVGTFQQSGIAPAPNNANWFNAGLAWMSADKRCHESGFVTNPFTGQSTPNENDIIHDLIPLVIANRQHQIQTNQTTPSQPVPHVARVSPNEDLRGIDDPHEWYLGRLGQTPPTPQPGDILQRDDAFFNAVQPGAAGTWLGHKEARLILNGKLYVGSADGIVSCFQVNMQDQHLPLQRQAVTSRALGHQAWGMAALSSGELIVATRRHLFKLDPNTPDLAVLATSSIIPFEIAKPYRLHVGH
ncbi:MAG TPA: hypothetical protein VK348_02500, partial [Planctomycetota bacterium]|nr:hypothetical protein [Planctomycetota bacterium]